MGIWALASFNKLIYALEWSPPFTMTDAIRLGMGMRTRVRGHADLHGKPRCPTWFCHGRFAFLHTLFHVQPTPSLSVKYLLAKGKKVHFGMC